MSARASLAIAIALLATLAPRAASAQRRPAKPGPAAERKPEAAAPTTPPSPSRDLVRGTPGGLTAEQAARRAAQTSPNARASDAALMAATAHVDAAWVAFLPRLTGTARYLRLSSFEPQTIPETDIALPIAVNQYTFQAGVIVPISDYFLRINQAYTAATHAETAARHDRVAALAKAASDARVFYYGWLTARAASTVADATLELERTLVQDAKNQFAAGNASRADVLQAESAVAAAELSVERAKNLVRLSEKQLRIAMHAPDDEALVPGEDLEAELAAIGATLAESIRDAHASRPELASLDANAAALQAQARGARGSRYPSIAAIGDGVYANPNPRRFPQQNEWFGTWAVGAQVTFSPNDWISGSALGREADARAAQLVAQKDAMRDGIEIEVTQAWQNVQESKLATETTVRQLESAAEAYRVVRELFAQGRATATQVREADTAFTRARLDFISARAQARTARVRLEHATGRDAQDR